MYYEAHAPDEYLSDLEGDWRKEKLIAIRETIMGNEPKLVEGIKYKMLSYSNGEKNIFLIKKNQDLEKTNLNEFISRVIRHWGEGKDTDC